MFGLTTTAKLRAAEEAALQMHRENSELRSKLRAADAAYEKERAESIKKGRLASELLAERDAAHDKLREIVAAETPACAGIGKKMARIAREGLPEFAVPVETAEAA
ncbi:hypothetical protein [Sphingomonas sp.]|uniref:hypothetical protein n=1 Tax=Sphingomonas sp. TaxID=28214 RepID=UPI003BAD5F9E